MEMLFVTCARWQIDIHVYFYSQSGVENQRLGIGTYVGTVGAGFDQFKTNVVLSRVWAMVWLKWSQSLPPKKVISVIVKSFTLACGKYLQIFFRIPSLISNGSYPTSPFPSHKYCHTESDYFLRISSPPPLIKILKI